MLDGVIRRKIEPTLDAMGKWLAGRGWTANMVTAAGFMLGLAAAAAIATGWFLVGMVLILASRLCDGLDGAVARAAGKTDFGGFLDIVLDFAFYGAVPLAFAIADPQANAVPAAWLLLAFYFNGASFLAYAIMAEKRKLQSEERGEKSLYFTTGLAEAAETIGIFILMCLAPTWFPVLAYLFTVVCLYTTASRIWLARRQFRDATGK